MAGGGKNKLEYLKQDTPKFLKDFKARVNYKEGPTVETKKQQLKKKIEDDCDDVDRDDEKPVICVLKVGDLTEEEYEKHNKVTTDSEKDVEVETGGKIEFKKPVKRTSDSEPNVSGKKKRAHKDGKNREKKTLNNKKLLSFGEEEEEED